MADASADILALQDHKERLLELVAGIDERIASLGENGHPETGIGEEDEPHRMKREALETQIETATAEPLAERAVKPRPPKRKVAK